jgi:hypothetical protein
MSDTFDDADQLGAFMDDMRARDSKMSSAYADAKAVVATFAAETGAGAWSSLQRDVVAARLTQLATDPSVPAGQPLDYSVGPRSVQQAGMNLCGPAAFCQMALGRDPVAMMRFATDLFDKGTASIGSLKIAPGQDLLGADYAAMARQGNPSSQAEWMLLGALRNSTEAFWQPSWTGNPQQELAAMTRPEELAGWMRQSGIWSKVTDGGKWATNPGIPAATDLMQGEGIDIALLIQINLLVGSKLEPAGPVPAAAPERNALLAQFPNHWVVLLSEIVPDTAQENLTFTIWTWGGGLKVTAPKQVFLNNYYGAVTASL